MIAGLQHAHLLGVGMTTRHFRNGTEIEPLFDDPNYDYYFQEMRPLKRERLIKPVSTVNAEKFVNFNFAKNLWMRSFAKIISSRNGEITLFFTTAIVVNFEHGYMSFSDILKSKI